jgi:hypothetical protein
LHRRLAVNLQDAEYGMPCLQTLQTIRQAQYVFGARLSLTYVLLLLLHCSCAAACFRCLLKMPTAWWMLRVAC